MTYKEIQDEIQHLSREERLGLIDFIMHSLQTERVSDDDGTALLAMRGILSTEGPAPTDEELMEEYTQYLIEKYS
ncbi:MAG TPA: hypothetical protein VF707_20750 [Ardenticatenaceae bacterium]